ncbi:hypothetical protein CSUI_008533 [Cystoisospora suis]|uniref:Uncharacterized protein n=1 Tax=Cystoisospora suis TaxID=483139 RepID=A0A2C6KMM7_9APIC|nr:hypothetical protein CSUI_008533 [Cystoisospora suis]
MSMLKSRKVQSPSLPPPPYIFPSVPSCLSLSVSRRPPSLIPLFHRDSGHLHLCPSPSLRTRLEWSSS